MSAADKYYKEIEKPIIFIGNPRSGTSVITEIIARHKDLGFPSHYQNLFLKNTSFNFFRRFFDNGLWRIHGSKKQLNKVHVLKRLTFRHAETYKMWKAVLDEDINFGRGFLLNTRASEENIAFLRKFFSRIVRYQGKRRLVFKITGPSRIEYLSSIFPDAQFVYIQRNPVSTVSSLLRVGFWKSLGQHRLWWTGVYSEEEKRWAEQNKEDGVAMTAFQVKKVAEVTEQEIEKTGVDVLRVKYSDFVKSTRKSNPRYP